jgi:hypothetical protein
MQFPNFPVRYDILNYVNQMFENAIMLKLKS